MSFREISEKEFVAEFDRCVKELKGALFIGNDATKENK